MLKLYTPKSFLKFATNMTVGELKNVTSQDLLEYSAEFKKDIEPSYTDDYSVVETTNQKMVALAEEIYGTNSKQRKYLIRNFRKGESVVDSHYSTFPSPETLKEWVENAQSGFYEDYCVPAQQYQRKEEE